VTATSVITAAGKRHFAPLGVTQKGRSRSWVDDHGWWLGIIEFQPSSYSKGSYLNVAVMWLWNVADHFAFDIVQRIDGYVPYVSDSEFAPEADRLAELAVVQLTEFRRKFYGAASTATYLRATMGSSVNDCLNAGMAYGLAGNRDAALPFLKRYVAHEDNRIWAIQKRAEVATLLSQPNAETTRLAIEDKVRSCRQALRLPPMGVDSEDL
jgi:hypothetical protein